MAVLTLNNISKSYGTTEILNSITFSVEENEKIGMVGKNGAGKTTIFKMISSELTPDSGSLYFDGEKRVGYLSQNLGIDENTTVFKETIKVYQNLIDIEKRMREIENSIALLSENPESSEYKSLLKEYGNLQEEFERNNGYGIESFARGILIGLGIKPDDFNKEIRFLSGGQKTRVALAKLLLENPDILLLDEPTNHLDLNAISYLEGFLKDYKGTVIIVSHDRYFLDVITQRTLEVIDGQIEDYKGNYSFFIKERSVRYEQRLKDYELQQKEIKRLEDIIDKYRSFNREKSIKQAESREKALQKIEVIEKPKVMDHQARITFDINIRSGNDVLIIENMSKSFGKNKLFEDLSFMIRRNERTALIGENGKGKTTILKIISGLLEPDSGYLKLGRNVEIGYYDQEQKNISMSKTIIDEIWDEYPDMTVTAVRNALASMLFTGDDVFKPIDTLSGGEKCRISLLKLMLSKSNFLLLDEPTNHLDILSREALEDSLLEYPGTLFVISHDRYFLNKVVGRILELDENGLTEYAGNFNYYISKKNSGADDIVINTQGKTKTEIKEERRKIRESQENKKKLLDELKSTEKNISLLEAEINRLENELCKEEVYSNPVLSKSTADSLSDAKKDLDSSYERWQELLELTES